MELINKFRFPNKWWTKSSINRLLRKLRDTAQSTDLQELAADHDAVLKKMLIQLTIWFWVKKIRHRLIEKSVKSQARQAFGWDVMKLTPSVW